MTKKGRRAAEVDEQIKIVLKKAPEFKGYTIKQLAEVIDRPWPTTRWHLERLSSRGEVTSLEIGRAKLYSLSPKRQKARKQKRAK